MKRAKSPGLSLALACAGWLTATAAVAQAPPASPAAAAQAAAPKAEAPATAVSPLTVQGTTRAELQKQANAFVESYAQPTKKLGLLARWNDPTCVAVTGLAAQQAAQFKTQIEAVAKAVKAPVGGPKCAPNIEIVFTNEPQRYLDAAARRRPTALGGSDKTVTRPIQAWYATGDAGMAPPPDGGLKSAGAQLDLHDSKLVFSSGAERFQDKLGAEAPRRCVDPGVASHQPRMESHEVGAPDLVTDISCPHSTFLNVLIVVDVAHMGDVSVDLTSDYLALLALSQPKPRSLDGCLALPSVLDLYAANCPGREAPTGLTAADKAYLTGLYAADLSQVKLGQGAQAEIAGRMVKTLDSAREAER